MKLSMDLFNDNRTNRSQSRCGPSQWETPLYLNGVSDWLGAYLGCFRYQYIHWRSDSCDSGSDCALQYFVKNLYVLGWTVKGPTPAYWCLCPKLSAFYLECNLWTTTTMALQRRVALMPTLFSSLAKPVATLAMMPTLSSLEAPPSVSQHCHTVKIFVTDCTVDWKLRYCQWWQKVGIVTTLGFQRGLFVFLLLNSGV